jgi:SAM-dependent methyltransferase
MTTHLSEQFWEERYLHGQTGWDMGCVSPPLKAYVDQLPSKDIAILIPGCGNAYEAIYLAQSGFGDVTVVDIASAPLRNLREKLAREQVKNVRLLHADFFDLAGSYGLMLEQTFFCAIDPGLRSAYVQKACELLAPDGVLAGVLFASPFKDDGPPYGGTEQEYRPLFDKKFSIDTMAPCYNSHPKRMGNELFICMHPLKPA